MVSVVTDCGVDDDKESIDIGRSRLLKSLNSAPLFGKVSYVLEL